MTVVCLEGEHDIATLPLLNLAMSTAISTDTDDVVIDLGGVTFLSAATIAILQHRATVQADLLVDQLNHALNSRVLIEQAKGILAERSSLDMEGAFSWLRHHARSNNLRLVDVAQSIIDGTVAPEPPLAGRSSSL